MYCIHCGTKLRDGAKFCTACGKPVKASAPQTSTPAQPDPATSGERQPRPPAESGRKVEKAIDFAKAGAKEVIAALKDSDIKASPASGEVRCKADAAQEAFMRLLRKGLICMALVISLTSAYAQDQVIRKTKGPQKVEEIKQGEWKLIKTSDKPFSKSVGSGNSSLEVKVSGGTISREPYDIYSSGKSSSRTLRYAGTIKAGEKIAVSAEPLGTIDQSAPLNSMLLSISSTSMFAKRKLINMIDQTEQTTAKPKALKAEYKVVPEDNVVLVSATFSSSPNFYYCIEINYKLEGTLTDEEMNVAIDTEASDKADKTYDTDGIEGIVAIDDDSHPGNWKIPAAIAAAIAAIALAARAARKKKEGKENEKEEEEDEEEDEEKVSYEMRIRKDFGDTLTIGAAPQKVFARIVRIRGNGSSSTDSTLTGKIGISGDNYLKVSNVRHQGEYVVADVEAPETSCPPAEAVVTFRLSGSGASFANRMHFKIASQGIRFGQDDLTLPSGFDKVTRLPFIVEGLDNPEVSAIVTDGSYGGGDCGAYKVEIEYDDKEQVHYAVITEKLKKIEGEAGDYDTYFLQVTAKQGETTLMEPLPIHRYNMGLRLTVNNIGCYVVEEKGKHVPVETKATLSLYDYDLEQNKLLIWSPGVPEVDKGGQLVIPEEGGPVITAFSVDAVEKERQETVKGLRIFLDVKAALESGRACTFQCRAATLNAPSRIPVNVNVTVQDGKRSHSVQKRTLLTSQPQRELTQEAIKEDKRIAEGLANISSQIFTNQWVSRLFPLLNLIEAMEDGYDSAYGYDPDQVQTVKEIFGGFINGEIEGANGDFKPVTLADEMRMFMASFVQAAEDAQSTLGSGKAIMARIALGICTGGASEVFIAPTMAGLDLVCNGVEMGKGVIEAVESGKGKAEAIFTVGAKIMAREAISDYVGNQVGKGIGKAGEALKEAGFTKANMKKAGKEMLENSGFFSGKKAKSVVGAIETSTAASQKASATGKRLFDLGDTRLSGDDIELQKAFERNQAMAKQNIEDLQAAIDLYKMNPTAANLKMRNALVVKVQQSKSTMYKLQDYDNVSLDKVRADFNEVMGGFHKTAADRTMVDLAARHGIPLNQVKKFKATSASQAKVAAGKKLPIDSDTTIYIEKTDGTKVYFDEEEVTLVYNRHLYKETTGFDATDTAFETRNARKLDSTVIEDVLGNKESYGRDVEKMTQASRHAQALGDAEKVADAVEYKQKHWFDQGDDYVAKAKETTDVAEKEKFFELAEDCYEEGYRQGTKIYDNCTNSRDCMRAGVNGGSVIDDRFRTGIEAARAASSPTAQRSSVEVKRVHEQLGFSRDSFAEEGGNIVRKIG